MRTVPTHLAAADTRASAIIAHRMSCCSAISAPPSAPARHELRHRGQFRVVCFRRLRYCVWADVLWIVECLGGHSLPSGDQAVATFATPDPPLANLPKCVLAA